jgi:hypothetical protein
MGQYHYICNLDKKEYLHPHDFGDGLKLMEFGCSGEGTLLGLTILLAASNGRGGGDLRSEDTEYVGRWVGDRLAIIGDYYEHSDVQDKMGFDAGNDNPWNEGPAGHSDWTNISAQVIAVANSAGERIRTRSW